MSNLEKLLVGRFNYRKAQEILKFLKDQQAERVIEEEMEHLHTQIEEYRCSL